jgi:hypothetical protein
MGGACNTYGVRRGAYSVLVRKNLRVRGNLGDPGVDGRIILKFCLQKVEFGAWTGLIWVKRREGGGLL